MTGGSLSLYPQWSNVSAWSEEFQELSLQRRLAYEDECAMSAFCQLFGGNCKGDFDTYGGFALMFLVVLYTFKVLGSICDGHLTAIVGQIVLKLKIPEDVAGATFMAMSSSAPEVFLTIISTFMVESASGVACVVGSALFNLLIIVGVLPLVSSTGPLKICWFPTYRDVFYYTVSVVELLIFCLDGQIVWYESLILCLTYGTYVAFFILYNKKWIEFYHLDLDNDIQGRREYQGQVVTYSEMCHRFSKEKISERELQSIWADLKPVEWMSEVDLDNFFKARMLRYFDDDRHGSASELALMKGLDQKPAHESIPSPHKIGLDSVELSISPQGVITSDPGDMPRRHETRDKISDLEGRVGDLDRRIQKYKSSTAFAAVAAQTLQKRRNAMAESLIALRGELTDGEDKEERDEGGSFTRNDPGLIIINKTVPDYSYTWTGFVIVMGWVAVFTYLMVEGANRFGCFVEVPPFPMGLVILAAGTSVPDLVASMAVAREGFADMAAANAVGGNTFKNLIGLGFPWLIANVIKGPVAVPKDELFEAMCLLLFSIVAYLGAVRLNGWVLDRPIGFFMIISYALGILYCLVREYTYFVKHREV